VAALPWQFIPAVGISMSETKVVSACLDWLAKNRIMAWRNNTGAAKIGDHYVSFGSKGSSDIVGVLSSGRFLAIECKFGKGRQSPEQKTFQKMIEKNNGLYILAYSVDDLERNLVEHIRIAPL
jgi:hypothetical protein